MIDPNPNEGGSESGAQEAAPESNIIQLGQMVAPLRLRPNANNVWLDYRPPGETKEGGIIVPGSARKLDFVTARVLAKGPDCRMVKEGDKILVAAKGIVNGEQGILIEGRRVYVTQEQIIVAVIDEGAPAASQ